MAGIGKLKEFLKKVVAEEGDAEKISLGFAMGVFISFNPLLSTHTVTALALAAYFRLNKISALAGAWVNNYLTIPFVYYFSYKVGAMILGDARPPPSFEGFSLKIFFEYVKAYGLPLFLGTTITGLVAAFISYYIMLYSLKVYRRGKEKAGGSGEGS